MSSFKAETPSGVSERHALADEAVRDNKPTSHMKILHTVTLSCHATGEQSTRHIIRNRRLTYRGCERILRTAGYSVVRVETAIFA